MTDLLAGVTGPQDLKKLGLKELEALAGEIRQKIIETVSRTGGHLAPSLGVVELTLALHRVYESPRDRIIWDVGHQAYAHKILTGRLAEFDTLRQFGGISGFPKPSESAHDAFGTGHASTSISAALGMAKARDLHGEDYHVVAVIGDGAMTGGLAFEGLDHAGHDGTNLLVVLNDNSMSIAPNVGALSTYLTRLRAEPAYGRLKRDIETALKRIPRIGPSVARLAERLKDSLKHLVVPGAFFEELGFTYFGPLDGHNLGVLIPAIERAKQVKGPVLLHVITQKGKGYGPAEAGPDKFHGPGPFDIATGERLSTGSGLTYTEVFGRAMVRLAEKDDRVVAITAAMPEGTGLTEFARRFPKRFFDVGIAEGHAVTFAAGLASQGMHPVFAVYSTFLQRGYDQVIHDVALQGLPVVLAIDRGGIVGDDGPTHHGVFDYAYLRSVPNMVLMSPKDENELQHMIKTALDYDRGPIALRYPRGKGLGVKLDSEPRPLEIGRGEVIRRGRSAAVIAIGSMVAPALEAAEILASEGVEVTVVNARFVKPLDVALIESVARETGAVVTVEEGVAQGGFGSAVLELLAEKGLTGKVVSRIIGIPDRFIEHGQPKLLLKDIGLDAEGIARAVREVAGGRRLLLSLARRAGK